MGGNGGYPWWICIQIGEGFAGRPCRPDRRGKGCAGANAGEVIGGQIGRKDGGFRGGLPCPAKAVSRRGAHLPAVRQRRHVPSAAGRSPGRVAGCGRRRGHLLAPRPLLRRSRLAVAGEVIGRGKREGSGRRPRPRCSRSRRRVLAGPCPPHVARPRPEAGQEIRGGLLRNVKVCGGIRALKKPERECGMFG